MGKIIAAVLCMPIAVIVWVLSSYWKVDLDTRLVSLAAILVVSIFSFIIGTIEVNK